jgi:hypothetical protein
MRRRKLTSSYIFVSNVLISLPPSTAVLYFAGNNSKTSIHFFTNFKDSVDNGKATEYFQQNLVELGGNFEKLPVITSVFLTLSTQATFPTIQPTVNANTNTIGLSQNTNGKSSSIIIATVITGFFLFSFIGAFTFYYVNLSMLLGNKIKPPITECDIEANSLPKETFNFNRIKLDNNNAPPKESKSDDGHHNNCIYIYIYFL